jgi:hypothetical protein
LNPPSQVALAFRVGMVAPERVPANNITGIQVQSL